jgi:hypothetical protein
MVIPWPLPFIDMTPLSFLDLEKSITKLFKSRLKGLFELLTRLSSLSDAMQSVVKSIALHEALPKSPLNFCHAVCSPSFAIIAGSVTFSPSSATSTA